MHAAIMEAAAHPQVNAECIGVLGGSKGAELALVLARYYPEIKAVVGIVRGHAVFAALTNTMSTSSWSLNGNALPFVPVPESAVPFLLPPENRNLRLAWEEMLKDEEAVERAAIAVERINGPILLVSATRDEWWPSMEMSEAIEQRLRESSFPYEFEHVAIEGRHNDAYAHPNLAEEFLRANLLQQSAAGCPRRRE